MFLAMAMSMAMELVNNNQDYTFKVNNIGLGSPRYPHGPSKGGKASELAK